MFFMKLLAFTPLEFLKNRYNEIKRIFQTEITSDFWFSFERNYLKDENHMKKWSLT